MTPDREKLALEALRAEDQKLREYLARDCQGDSPVKEHARTIAEGRLQEVSFLRAALEQEGRADG